MIGGTAQADENTETTAAPITPVAEGGETTASLVETRTVAETTPQRQIQFQLRQRKQVLKHQLLLKRLRHQQRLQQLRRALHHKLQQHQKQQVQRLQLLLKPHASTSEAAPATNSSEAENHAFVHVVRFLLQRSHLQQKHLPRMYQLRLKLVTSITIRTDSASTVKVTVDGQEVSLTGRWCYTFKRPSAGGIVVQQLQMRLVKRYETVDCITVL